MTEEQNLWVRKKVEKILGEYRDKVIDLAAAQQILSDVQKVYNQSKHNDEVLEVLLDDVIEPLY